MLNIFSRLTVTQAIDQFFSIPAQQNISHHKLDVMQWQVLQDLEVVLEVSLNILKKCTSDSSY
jgi:hypothetical protein